MKVWVEIHDGWIETMRIHWEEPDWDDVAGWHSYGKFFSLPPRWGEEMFCLRRLPDKQTHELFELDLSGRPKLVCVWVPGE